MTDKERFEKRAIENNAKILENSDNILIVLSANGKIKTTYFFNNNGKFENFQH